MTRNLEISIFDKCFHFTLTSREELSTKQLFTSNVEDVKELLIHKTDLNNVKSSLNNQDIIRWRKHTNYIDPSMEVIPRLRHLIHPELVTKAWCKIHEILSGYHLLPDVDGPTLNCVHLCEGPGSFVSSINHFMRSRPFYNKLNYEWIASSLNPYYEDNPLDICISDDRLMIHTLNRWCFGRDNSGDIFQPGLISNLKTQSKNVFKSDQIHLVTADGGFNCQKEPANQEKIVSQLLYCEVLTAISLLSKGGNFLLKMFTMFELTSVSLMYLLHQLFDHLTVVKPATSKSGNSEVYVVARGFIGEDKAPLSQMKEQFPFTNLKDISMFSLKEIPNWFLKQHIECVSAFKNWQIDSIQRNLFYFEKNEKELLNKICEEKKIVAETYFDKCDLKVLKRNHLLMTSGFLRTYFRSNIEAAPRLVGSYNNRNQMEIEINTEENKKKTSFIPKGQNLRRGQDCGTVCLVYGRPLTAIYSSLYCGTKLMVQYKMIFEKVEEKLQNFNFVFIEKDFCEIENHLIENYPQVLNFSEESTFCELISQSNSLQAVYSSWFTNFLLSKNQNIKSVSYKPNILINLQILNLIHQPKHQHQDELMMRRALLDCVDKMIVSLAVRGNLVVFFPSSLCRLVAHFLWSMSRLFHQSFITTLNPQNLPAVNVFFGVDFDPSEKYINLLLKASSEFEKEGLELLQLFPVSSLLKIRFSELLRDGNEKCLQERIKFFKKFIN